MGKADLAKSSKKVPAAEPKAVLNVTPAGMTAATGSQSIHFQRELLDQVTTSLWLPEWKSEEKKIEAAKAAFDALQKIAPQSELEGMLAAQMISTHNAAMECLRRSMMEGQTFEGRNLALTHAAKLLGLYERQLAALDKHRGKGQQKITVEHVTVEAGGQAIVGTVQAGPTTAHSRKVAPPVLTDERANEALSALRLDAVPKKTDARVRKPRRS